MVILEHTKTMESHLKLQELEQVAEKFRPEDYLVSTKNISTRSLQLLKELYNVTKAAENETASSSTLQKLLPNNNSSITSQGSKKKQKGPLFSKTEVPLSSLITDNFDEDQIWEELQLQNGQIYDTLVSAVSKVLAHKPRRQATGSGDEPEKDSEDEDILKELQEDDDDINEDDFSDFFESDEKYKRTLKKQPNYSKSIVDDKFFNLAQMTEFVDKMDAEAEKGEREEANDEEDDDNSADLFKDDDEGEDDPENDYYYKDFFDPPLDEELQMSDSKKGREEVEDDEEVEDSSDDKETELDKIVPDEEESSEEDEATLSTFEKKRRKIDENIKAMEEEALKPKSWQLTGEVTAQTRPENSLLEEHLMYDHLLRQAPEITLKTTQKLEDIIKQRVKDQAWDDVIRKIKPIENVSEYKKRLVLDAEKSKMSLTEIYEQEYIDKQKQSEETTEEDKEPEEHKVIQKDMVALFAKLDALSHFNYTPKAPMPEIKTIKNATATAMEEITPSTYSEAMLLAPQEMLEPAKGEIKSKRERTTTDRKRERRLKKKKQHLKRLAEEDKARTKGLGLRNIKLAESVVKKSKSDLESSHNSKELKSSKAFFAKLQDQVSNHIDKVSKRKKESVSANAVSAKKFKL